MWHPFSTSLTYFSGVSCPASQALPRAAFWNQLVLSPLFVLLFAGWSHCECFESCLLGNKNITLRSNITWFSSKTGNLSTFPSFCLCVHLPMIPAKIFLNTNAPMHIHSMTYILATTGLTAFTMSFKISYQWSNVNSWNKVIKAFFNVLKEICRKMLVVKNSQIDVIYIVP